MLSTLSVSVQDSPSLEDDWQDTMPHTNEHHVHIMDTNDNKKHFRQKVNRMVRHSVHINAQVSESNLREFVTKNVKERECAVYVRTSSQQSNCVCGQDKNWHKKRGIYDRHNAPSSWSPEKNTRRVKCSAYGEVLFSGFGSGGTANLNNAPYIRLESDTDAEKIWTLMHSLWKVPPPKMVVSVTGGARKFYMTRKLKQAFKQGLSNVATSTDAWIITGGTATGVMQFVGEALQDCRLSSETKEIVAIGIATWGIVDNPDALRTGSDGLGNFPAVYHLRDCVNAHRMLDHNHTHFLLADNGTVGKYGVELDLRAKLQEHIRSKCTSCLHSGTGSHPGQCVQTPVVLIVCEGGANTVSTVADSLKCKTPCVIIQSSGRAADVLAKAYKLTKPRTPKEKYHESSSLHSELYDSVVRYELCPSKDKIEPTVDEIIDCMKYRDLITIYEPDDTDCAELDKAILRALLTAHRSNVQSQIDLALIWNRADIAREDIFSLETRPLWQNVPLDRVMYEALISGKENFVQLFIDNGVQTAEFLTAQALRELYKTCLEDTGNTMTAVQRHLMQKLSVYERVFSPFDNKIPDIEPADGRLLTVMGNMISYLVQDRIDNLYMDIEMHAEPSNTSTTIQTIDTRASHRLNPADNRSNRSRKSSKASDSDDGHLSDASLSSSVAEQNVFRDRRLQKIVPCAFDNPEREMFLWALMFDKRSIADMFWNIAPDPIGGALVASHLLKSLSGYASKLEETDLAHQLITRSIYYETMASGILATSYAMNKSFARKLLTRQLSSWGDATVFGLAESAQLMDFMQSSCCQTQLNQIWFGELADYTPDLKILLVAVCPLFLPIIKFKRGGNLDRASEQSEEDDQDLSPIAKSGSAHLTVNFREVSLRALYYFYNAPVTKFYTNLISYVLFLCIFTFVVLSRLRPLSEVYNLDIHVISELVAWSWMISFCMTEIYQFFGRKRKSIAMALRAYFRSFWNYLDLSINILFLVILSVRLVDCADCMDYSKRLYAFSILLNFMRILQMFNVWKPVGPKIIMIKQMIRDLMFFLCILGIFIVSFGVAMESLLYPKVDFTPLSILDALYEPYWQLYGELFLDTKEVPGKMFFVEEGKTPSRDQCSPNATYLTDDPPPCPTQTWLVPFMSAVYMMLNNILLINLLIAMFSYSFQQIQDRAEKVWRFHRYHLVLAFNETLTLPAPFVILSIIYRVLERCVNCMRSRRTRHLNAFRVELSLNMNLRMTSFVRQAKDKFLSDRKQQTAKTMQTQVKEIDNRSTKLLSSLNEVRENFLTKEGEELEDRETSAKDIERLFSKLSKTLSRDQKQLVYEVAKSLRKT